MAGKNGNPLWMVGTGVSAGKKSDQGAPSPGTRYNPPKAERAQHRSEAIADSAWSDRSYSDTLKSKQPASKIPPEATSSDNAYAKSLLASDTSNQRSKPDIFK